MKTRRTFYAIILSLMLIPAIGYAGTGLENRLVTPEEIKSFNDFYLKLHPTSKPVSPIFFANRTGKDKKWTVTASVFSISGRGYKKLCHGQEDNYVYSKPGAKEAEWKEGYQQVQYVWIDKGRDCKNAARRVELTTPLPDVDVLEVLESTHLILHRYAAFIKGFSCRRMGSGALRLAGIGTGSDNNGEIMVKLVYKNDADDSGDLLVRKIGRDFTPWDFRCSMP